MWGVEDVWAVGSRGTGGGAAAGGSRLRGACLCRVRGAWEWRTCGLWGAGDPAVLQLQVGSGWVCVVGWHGRVCVECRNVISLLSRPILPGPPDARRIVCKGP